MEKYKNKREKGKGCKERGSWGEKKNKGFYFPKMSLMC